MAKKLFRLLVVVVVLGGGAFVAWQQLPKQKQKPEPQPTEAPKPAPPQPLSLDRLGCKLQPAAGWRVADDAPEQKAIPGDQVVVLRKQGAGRLPLFVIGRLTGDILGAIEPKAYPESFVNALKKRLAKLPQPPKVTQAGAFKELPKLFATGWFATAEGSFPELGASNGTGLFAAGASASGDVYVIAAFAPAGSPEDSDVIRMVQSLEPLAKPAESGEKTAEPTKPAERPAAGATDGGPAKEPEPKADEGKAPAKAEDGKAPAKTEDGKASESLDPKAPAKAEDSKATEGKPAEAPAKEAPKSETP